jgi:hypothetical protein
LIVIQNARYFSGRDEEPSVNRASQPILAKPDAASEAGSVPPPRLWDRLYSRVRPRRASATGDAARRATRRKERLLVIYGILAISGLIVLRATVDAVDFLSVGWILVLVALPLLPWLLPRLGDFLKAISPYVQTLKLGALQLDLRAVQREPVSVPSSGIFAGVPNDAAALRQERRLRNWFRLCASYAGRVQGPSASSTFEMASNGAYPTSTFWRGC